MPDLLPLTDSKSIADKVLIEQVKALERASTGARVATFIMGAAASWLCRSDSNQWLLLAWLTAQVLFNLSAILRTLYLRRQPLNASNAHQRLRSSTMLPTINGLLWAAGIWIMWTPDNLELQLLLIFIIVGISMGSIQTLKAHLPALFRFFIPCVVSIVVMAFAYPGRYSLGIGICTSVYMAWCIGYGITAHRELLQSIRRSFEFEELANSLQVQKDIAEAATLAKSRFLAAASHDLRQPVHAQGLFLDALSRTNLSPAQHELVASAVAAGSASAEMLNTLLDFSRIEAGVIEPQIEDFMVQPLLNKIEREFVLQADAKGLEYRSRESALAVQSDPALIELILRNLVSNAIRYTERGGVLVICRRRGSDAVLEVFDTGIGIEASQQREVFREFHQLGNAERDRTKGLGLGLAIVDGLARTLGHTLSLKSRLARGSVFRLIVPLATEAPVATPAVAKPQVAQSLRVRVLVVDDDELVRHSMQHLLRDWGCECHAVESIEAALSLASKLEPEVIISDYRLRNQCTGVEVIDALRAALGRDVPALLITGDTAPQRLRDAIGSGLPLLHKPVSPNRLYRELVTVLPG